MRVQLIKNGKKVTAFGMSYSWRFGMGWYMGTTGAGKTDDGG